MRRRLLTLAACAIAACGGEAPRATGWSAPVALGGRTAPDDDLASVGMDAAGNAFATWSGGGVAAARFDARTRAWAAPLRLATANADDARQLDLAVGPAGDAVVVWRQLSAGLLSIWSSWFDPMTGAWHEAAPVERDETGDASGPCVAALPAGGAVAVWHQWDGLRESLWANRLGGAPLAWTGRSRLETTDSADALEPEVAADSMGNALAVWTQTDGAVVTVWAARRITTDDAWSAPTMLSETGIDDPRATPAPRVALDDSGNGFALWSLTTRDGPGLWARRYHMATDSWEAAVTIDDSKGDGTALAVDRNGNAFVAWRRGDVGGEALPLWANTFAAQSGTWTGAVQLDGDAGPPSVAAAGDHQAMVLWSQRGRSDLRASRFDPRSGTWGTAAALAVGEVSPEGARVAVDAAGDAIAIFTRREGSSSGLWSVHAAR